MDDHVATDATATNPSKTTTNYGKDSMNFAEWPLALLNQHGAPSKTKSVTFTDKVRHPKTGEMVDRSMTINPSADFGHPTGPDADVLLGLIQITQQENNFTNQLVTFSRYQLIKLIGWDDTGWSYKRIEESINRWASLTLRYRRAWWNTETNDWVNHTFSPITDAYIHEQPRNPISIKWNEHVFADFQKNIKPIDLGLYFSLKRTGSKQIYAYLDKHFHRPGRRTYDLRQFATAHAGLSDKHDNSQLKRQLQKYVTELEDKEFLKSLPATRRYEQVRRGQWKVHFDRAPKKKAKPKNGKQQPTTVAPLTQQLIDRGIEAKAAATLIKKYPAKQITIQIEAFDWRNKRVGEYGAGYLRKAIETPYPLPDDFQSKEQIQSAQNKKKEAVRKQAKERKEQQQQKAEDEKRTVELNAKWDALPEIRREQIRQKVFAKNKMVETRYRKKPDSSIIHEIFLHQLEAQQATVEK